MRIMPKRKLSRRKQPPTLLILLGLALVLIAIFTLKSEGDTPVSAETLEEQLDQALGRWNERLEKMAGVVILAVGLYFVWIA